MRKFLTIVFVLTFLVTSNSLFAQTKDCGCKTALKSDIPLGGNIVIVERAGKVKQIRGITTFAVDGKTFRDVVVEVFKIAKSEEKNIVNDAWKVVENNKRKTACITNKNGKFCFKGLPKGTYVLRVGTRTRKVEYFNYVHIIVKVNPKVGKDKEIKVGLSVAT